MHSFTRHNFGQSPSQNPSSAIVQGKHSRSHLSTPQTKGLTATQIQPLTHQIHPSSSKTDSPTFYSRLPKSHAYPSTSQACPPIPSPTSQTFLSTPQTHIRDASTPKTWTSTSQKHPTNMSQKSRSKVSEGMSPMEKVSKSKYMPNNGINIVYVAKKTGCK